jgi:microcystin-dependent protein
MKKLFFLGLFMILSFGKTKAQDGFIGEIRMFAGNFAPKNWAFCQGQILSIAQNTALFSILGTTYGGNGTTTFALPDLSGRVPVGVGQGPGLTPRQLGEINGTETVTLTTAQMPMHNHTVNAVTTEGNQNLPTGNLPANTKTLDKEYSDANTNTTMKSTMVNPAGGSQPFSVMQPSLGMNYIICLYGVYPARN